jgi:Predicted transcriptional regulator
MDRILRMPDVQDLTGLKRSSLYLAVASGTFPQPIHISYRSIGWPASEVQAIIRARIRGEDVDTIKKLVASLVENRKQLGVTS